MTCLSGNLQTIFVALQGGGEETDSPVRAAETRQSATHANVITHLPKQFERIAMARDCEVELSKTVKNPAFCRQRERFHRAVFDRGKHRQTTIDVANGLVEVAQGPLHHTEHDTDLCVRPRIAGRQPQRLHAIRQRGFKIGAYVLHESDRSESQAFGGSVFKICAMVAASVARVCIRSHCSDPRRT